MQYTAVMLCPEGGIIRHKDTQEVANLSIGDFESQEHAIAQACLDLGCHLLHNGVISKGKNRGGFLILSTQELAEV